MHLPGCVAAQCALQGEESAFSAHIRGKRGREIAEHVADTMSRSGTIEQRGAQCPSGTGAGIGSRWGRCDGGVGDDGASATELGLIPDPDAVRAVWEDTVAAPDWAGPPLWVHGDLYLANVPTAGGTSAA